MTRDEKEIEKADENIKEKGKDGQTRRDREDESVAAQERASGTEDSQTAKDRIDESEGAREKDREAKEERKDARADSLEAAIHQALTPLMEKLADLEGQLTAIKRTPQPVRDEDRTARLESVKRKFNT